MSSFQQLTIFMNFGFIPSYNTVKNIALKTMHPQLKVTLIGRVNFIKKNVLKRTSANMKVFSIVKITQPSVLKFEVGNLHKFGPEGGI